MNTCTKFITITLTSLLMGTPLYASYDNLDGESSGSSKINCVNAGQLTGIEFSDYNKDIQVLFIEEIGIQKTLTGDSVWELGYVNKLWQTTIDNLFGSSYDLHVTWQDTMIIGAPLRFRPLNWNATFDLSAGNWANQNLKLTTCIRAFLKIDESSPHVNILITHYSLVKEYSSRGQDHFSQILAEWDPKTAPIGIFWRWSTTIKGYDYAFLSEPELHYKNLAELRNSHMKPLIRGIPGGVVNLAPGAVYDDQFVRHGLPGSLDYCKNFHIIDANQPEPEPIENDSSM